jgi:hypothetical protein
MFSIILLICLGVTIWIARVGYLKGLAIPGLPYFEEFAKIFAPPEARVIVMPPEFFKHNEKYYERIDWACANAMGTAGCSKIRPKETIEADLKFKQSYELKKDHILVFSWAVEREKGKEVDILIYRIIADKLQKPAIVYDDADEIEMEKIYKIEKDFKFDYLGVRTSGTKAFKAFAAAIYREL